MRRRRPTRKNSVKMLYVSILVILAGMVEVFFIYKMRSIEGMTGMLILWFQVVHFSITAHEVGHLMYYVWKKRPVCYLYIIPFLVLPESGYIKVKLDISCMGLVIPEVGVLDQEGEGRIRKEICQDILMGPMINIILLMSSAGCWALNPQEKIFSMGMIVNIIMLAMCFQNTSGCYGDFAAYKKIREDQLFYMEVLYSDCMKSADGFCQDNKDYLIAGLLRYLNQSNETAVTYRAILFLLQEELKCSRQLLDDAAEQLVEKIMKDDVVLDCQGALFILLKERIVLYLLKNNRHREAGKLFEEIGQHIGYVYKECEWMVNGAENPKETSLKRLNTRENRNVYIEEYKIIEYLKTIKNI